MLAILMGAVALGAASGLVFLYYLRQGQFNDGEDVKYQMFRDDERQRRQ